MTDTITKEPSNRFASLRLTASERDTFQQVAEQLQTTPSRLLRKIIRELIGQGPDLLAQDVRVVEQATYQLGCLGRNLNQLLRTIHTRQVTTTGDQQDLIESLRDQVECLHEELDRVITRSYERWVIEERPNQLLGRER
jgi:hypothetical protein